MHVRFSERLECRVGGRQDEEGVNLDLCICKKLGFHSRGEWVRIEGF